MDKKVRKKVEKQLSSLTILPAEEKVIKVPKNYNPSKDLYVDNSYPDDWSQIRILQDSYLEHCITLDSYDPDATENNPIILHGHRSPDQSKRFDQRAKRSRYIPKKLIKFYQTSLLESEEQKLNFVSEVERAYSVCLKVHVSLGQNIKAKQLLAALIYLFVEKGFQNCYGQNQFFEALISRCKANNYQGDWAKIAQIIQLTGDDTLVKEYLLELGLGNKRFDNDYLPKGKKVLQNVIKLRYFDKNEVIHPKFKSGYSRNNSQKEVYNYSKDEGSDSLIKSSKFNREIIVPVSKDESIWFWMNGNPLPERIVEFYNDDWGESIYKELNAKRRELDMKAEIATGVRDENGKRLKPAANQISSGYLSEEHLKRYIKIKESEIDQLQVMLDRKKKFMESLKKFK